MRLICPNCSAEYEVDAAAIPPAGRDVQCSNCGHAWFQYPEGVEPPDEDADPEAPEADLPPDAVTDVAEAEAEAEQFEAPVVAPVAAEAAVPPPHLPKALDEGVMAVLREEAEREARARRAEAPRPLETQGDLGLEPPALGAQASPLRGLPEPEPAAAALVAAAPDHRAASRRDLLPDIEEINSTLRATSDRGEEDEIADPRPPSRNGFRSGFVLMMVLLVVLVLAYTMAPRISAQMPGAAPAMDSYVRGVDQLRLWLDGIVKSATGAVEEVSPRTEG